MVAPILTVGGPKLQFYRQQQKVGAMASFPLNTSIWVQCSQIFTGLLNLKQMLTVTCDCLTIVGDFNNPTDHCKKHLTKLWWQNEITNEKIDNSVDRIIEIWKNSLNNSKIKKFKLIKSGFKFFHHIKSWSLYSNHR